MITRKFSAERVVAAATLVGVALRLAVGLWLGPLRFASEGYTDYLDTAGSFAGRPLYPLWIALFQAMGFVYPGVVIAQAIVGGALAWVTAQIGVRLFDARVGAAAALATALNPYAVVHDTALQDTVMFNAAVAVSIGLLLRAQARGREADSAAAGVPLAAAVAVSSRIALFLPCAIVWARPRRFLTVIVIAAMAWSLGSVAPTTGFSLWLANNPWTFSHFPGESIDLTVAEFERLPSERKAIRDAPQTNAEYDGLLRRWALEYMVSDPLQTLARAARKLWVVASAQLSPAHSPLAQLGFAAVFLPVNVLAAIGLWRSRSDWRTHSLIWSLFASFAVTTAVFWAHTSHKTYLDPFLFVYAAAAVTRRAP